ncbi:MAG: hypothetical protein IPP47_12490 [Bryobacterales bacterium]|nr:hypothetical protein [Bryobacterales bacterium]
MSAPTAFACPIATALPRAFLFIGGHGDCDNLQLVLTRDRHTATGPQGVSWIRYG